MITILRFHLRFQVSRFQDFTDLVRDFNGVASPLYLILAKIPIQSCRLWRITYNRAFGLSRMGRVTHNRAFGALTCEGRVAHDRAFGALLVIPRSMAQWTNLEQSYSHIENF